MFYGNSHSLAKLAAFVTLTIYNENSLVRLPPLNNVSSNSKCYIKSMLYLHQFQVQRTAKVLVRGLVKFVPAS